MDILEGREGPRRDVVVLNAGAVAYVAGLSSTIGDGIALARDAIDSGAAMEKLDSLRTWGDMGSRDDA